MTGQHRHRRIGLVGMGAIILVMVTYWLNWVLADDLSALRTIRNYQTGQPVADAPADGTVYEFEAKVPVNFWKVPAVLDGLWLESADKNTLLWVSTMSGGSGSGTDPCPGGTGGGGGNCPTNNLCGSTRRYALEYCKAI